MNRQFDPINTKMRTVDDITGGRRMRRNRKAPWVRDLTRENSLTCSDLIWPIFLIPGSNIREPITAMPGVDRVTPDLAARDAERAMELGIPAVATFPNIASDLRDQTGSNALDPDNLINEATKLIKDAVPELGVITDVALDPFTNHGHDGVLRDGVIVNDETVSLLARAAVLQADAGADVIAPSDMMDGRIGAIRDALDQAGHQDVGIMSYANEIRLEFLWPVSGGYRN